MFIFAQGGEATGTGGYSTLIFLALMAVVFYFLIIRPQRRRANEQKKLAATLSVGDNVQTIGGIVGTVVLVEDDEVVIETEGGRLRMATRAIASRKSEADEAGGDAAS